MLTVIVFVLLVSLLSGTRLVLSAVAFMVCWPFFALAVYQFTVTVADAPGLSAGVSIRPSTVAPSSRNSVFDAAAVAWPWFLIVAVNVTLSPCFAWLLLA